MPFVTARSELRKVLFLAPSVCFFSFAYEISLEPLNVLDQIRTEYEFEGQGQRSRSPEAKKTAFFGPFGGLCAVYVW